MTKLFDGNNILFKYYLAMHLNHQNLYFELIIIIIQK